MIRKIQILAHAVAACNEYVLVLLVCDNEFSRYIQRGHKPCARGIDVERSRIRSAQLVLHYRCCRRRDVVGCISGDDDEIELIGSDACVCERFPGSRNDQIGGRLVLRHVVPFKDIAVGAKKRVYVHVIHCVELAVRNDALGSVHAGADDLCSSHLAHHPAIDA